MTEGRFKNGFTPGRPKGATTRLHITSIVKRKAKEYGLDVEELVWNVMLTMLLQGAYGDTKAAKIALDHLGVKDQPDGPLVSIHGVPTGVPQLPPANKEQADANLQDHLDTLLRIAEERGLVNVVEGAPAQIVEQVADMTKTQKQAEEDLLS